MIGNSSAYNLYKSEWVLARKFAVWTQGRGVGACNCSAGNRLPGAERLLKGISGSHLKVQEVPRFQRE